MFALLAVFICLGFADVTRVYFDETLNTIDLINPELVEKKDSTIIRWNFLVAQCLDLVTADLTEPSNVIVETIRGHTDGVHNWIVVAESQEASTRHEIPVSSSCASVFRVRIATGSFVGLTVSHTETSHEQRKRAITCTVGDLWSIECVAASDGSFCVASALCGCNQDADCYTSTTYPYCDVGTKICDACIMVAGSDRTKTPVEATNPTSNINHYFCRSRFPSTYYANNLGANNQPAQLPTGENVAPAGFYREVCVSAANVVGSCERCNQASATNFLPGVITFPTFTGTTNQQNYKRGTFFCNMIRGKDAVDTTKRGRPICNDRNMWTDQGFVLLDRQTFKVTMEIANYGTKNGATTDGGKNVQVAQTIDRWEGACIPCVVDNAGVAKRIHSFCYNALPNQPICNADGNCYKCATNAECQLSSDRNNVNCATDKSGSCTGGANCGFNGNCFNCLTDADCGANKDGGEKPSQVKCDVATGVCIDAVLCDANAGETGTTVCGAATPNCNKNGNCIKCLTNADCGATDGGKTTDQQVCNVATGICGPCSTNANCVGTTGANCMQDGSCKDCTTSPTTICAVGADGGQPGAMPVCTANNFCADKKDQTICNTASKICEDPCLSNSFCSDKGGTGPTSGANCQQSGLCANCQTLPATTPVANSPNCGALDGPKTGLAGTSGTPNQSECSAAGICVDPFKCTDNASCAGKSGANCQADFSCLNCNIALATATTFTSTCGTLDGGAAGTTGQKNCNTGSRLCVNACTTNADCGGTQGANCMANGVCLDCRTDADCVPGTGAAANQWGGDINPTDVLCNAATKTCGPGCSSVTNSDCPAGQNCNKDGRCAACATNADCVANDGPPGKGSNTICKAGVCVDPYSCVADINDNTNCKALGSGNNCQADKSCKTCTANTDCGALDGGIKPKQPICNTATGVCRDCASNAECGGLNCNADGTCADCRLFPAGTTCGAVDGPPGANKVNLNCDSVSGACVDFCVADSNCLDSCAPKCQLERGCCVECLTNAHCPVPQWRGTQKATYTHCSPDFICTLPPPTIVCSRDSDCSGSTPACSFTQQKCVACVFDSHCSGSFCDTASQTCVQCYHDSHCVAGKMCDMRALACVNIPSPASAVVGSLALFVATVLAMFF